MPLIASYAPVTGTAYASFTSAQNVMANTLYVPPRFLDQATGPLYSTTATMSPAAVRVHAWGVYSTTGTPTAVAGLTALQAGTAITLGASAAFTTPTGASNLGWNLTWFGAADVRDTGGQFTGSGHVLYSAASAADSATLPIPTTTPQTDILYNFAEPAQWSIFWTWGTSSASNSVTVLGMTIEVL